MSKPTLYRGEWNIQPAYMGYQWSHVEYDGPEDKRIGQCRTVDECEREIDDWLIQDMGKALDEIDRLLRRAKHVDCESTRKAGEIAKAYYMGTDSEYEDRQQRYANSRSA